MPSLFVEFLTDQCTGIFSAMVTICSITTPDPTYVIGNATFQRAFQLTFYDLVWVITAAACGELASFNI